MLEESKCTECTRRVQASAQCTQCSQCTSVQAILCSPLRAQQAQQALCFGLAKLFVQIIALFPPQQRSVSLRNFRLPGTLRTGQGCVHCTHCTAYYGTQLCAYPDPKAKTFFTLYDLEATNWNFVMIGKTNFSVSMPL